MYMLFKKKITASIFIYNVWLIRNWESSVEGIRDEIKNCQKDECIMRATNWTCLLCKIIIGGSSLSPVLEPMDLILGISMKLTQWATKRTGHRRLLKPYYSCLKQIVLYFASFVTFTILLITYIFVVGSLDSNLIDPSCDQFHGFTFSTVSINKDLYLFFFFFLKTCTVNLHKLIV